MDNLIAYKRLIFVARRKILSAKTSSWENLVYDITSAAEVWRWVRAIIGSSVYKPLTALEQDGRVVCNGDEVVEILAAHYAADSSSNSYISSGETEKNRKQTNA